MRRHGLAAFAVLVLVAVWLQVLGDVSVASAQSSSVEPTESTALAAAKRSGSAVEIGSRRREASETYANPDGSFTTTEHLRPVRARKSGGWVPVDATLQRAASGVVRPVASTVDLEISGGTGPFVRMGRAGRELTLTWPKALPEPVVDGDTARFVDILPGVDLLVRADVDGVSHTFVVKTRPAADNPELARLTLGLGGSLSVRDGGEGGLTVVDTRSGGEVLEAPEPLMWDSTRSAGKVGATDAVDPAAGPVEGAKLAEVEASVTDAGLQLTPDAAMLDAADTVFPVYIDPVWKTVQASAWAMVSSGYPSESYYKFDGKSTEGVGRCEVSKDSTCVKDQTKRLFFRVPTSAYAGKGILSAEFVAQETHAYNCDNPTSVQLWRTKGFLSSSTWNSTSDNWLEHISSRDVAYCSSTPVEFNALSAVRDAAAAGWSTTTFGLRAASESGMAWWKRFKDDAYLRVNYNTPPTQPDNGDATMSPGGDCVGPTKPGLTNRYSQLLAVLTDRDAGDQVQAQFKIGWDTDGDGEITGQWTSPLTSPKAPGQFKITIPNNIGLPQNTLAGWSVRAYDGHSYSPWNYAGSATSCYFKYDATRPDPPAVSSTAYPASDPDNPDDPWIDGVGRYGLFTLDSPSTDATKYEYWFNDSAHVKVAPSSPGGPLTVQLAPTHAGLNYLRVQSFDAAGNASAVGQYMFRAKAGSAAKAAWSLDEPDGAAEVSDANGGFTAATHGGVTLGVAGVAKTAMQLNGTDGYADTSGPVVDTSKGFAVSAWARLPATKPNHAAVIATQLGSQRSGFELYYSSSYDRWIFNRYDADASAATIVRAQSASAPQGGEWAHLVGVYDAVAKTITLYVNGKPAQMTPYTKPWNATGRVQLGAGWYGNLDSFFSGELDDVRVFDRIVTGEEVGDLFTQRPVVTGRWALNSSGEQVPAANARWPLDEAAGATRAEDATGTYPAGKHGGVTFGVAGKTGAAARFDGSTGYAATSSPVVDTSMSFSVSAWAKLSSTKPSHAGIISTQIGAQRSGFELYYSAYYDRWIFNRYDADTTSATIVRAQSTTVPPASTWTHLTGVYDAGAQQIRLYVNGVLAQETTYTKPWNATGVMQLGAGWYGSRNSFFAGDVDDVRVFDQAITGSQAAVLAAGSPSAVSADDGSGGRHVTLAGNAVIDQGAGWVGNPAGGLVLDGDGDYASTAGPVVHTTKSFTVAGWVTTAGAPDHKVALFSQAGGTNSGFVVRYDPTAAVGNGGYQIEMPDADTASAGRPTADHSRFQAGFEWDHVALVYDAFGDQMRLYLNGQLEQTEDRVSWRSNVVGFDATGPLQLGRAKTNGTWGEYWPGVIDDVWAFDGVLSTEQIENLAWGVELPTSPGP